MNTMRARARQRNTRALAVSGGLVGFAVLCLVLFVTGFASLGASRADKRPTAVVKTTTTRPPAPATTKAPTTTSTSTTTASTTTSTSTTTTTTTIPPTTTTRPPRTTTTVKPVSAGVTVSDTPEPCTVTVRLSTGAFRSFSVDNEVPRNGDKYTFDAFVGGYHVDVTVRSVGRGDERHCVASLSHLRK